MKIYKITEASEYIGVSINTLKTLANKEILNMKTLRNPGKVDLLVNLFQAVGVTHTVARVCELTGIKSYNSLKAFASYIRRAKHIPDENRIDLRLKYESCTRVK